MKKKYTKPALDPKAYARFENVFTACSKGNEKKAGCFPSAYATPSPGHEYSAAYKTQISG